MDRTVKAFEAAQRIINTMREAGFEDLRDLMSPTRIIDTPDYIQWEYGATRLVVWDDECDYVVKVALDFDCEKYNEKEAEICATAEKEGFGDMFGWCKQYTAPQGKKEDYVPGIYVMEFLEGCEDDVTDSAYERGYKEFCRSNGLDESDFDSHDRYQEYREEVDIEEQDEIMELLVEGMSVSETYDFNSFLYDNNINDLHSANVLMKGDRFVICDYAGFGW